ncbi:gliding motility-associated C-terminal domain-containing protein [Spirosoma linguale]|uniref:gliding motility-associated C-terminal domain-containing protein n=1 Tax=Spirosoma linguale TaxID=108 RepID=UPI003CC7EDA0
MKEGKWLIWLFITISYTAPASHILGGDITMEYLGKPGYYRVGINFIFGAGYAPPKTVGISIYKKNTGGLVQNLTVDLAEIKPISLSYKDIPCIKSSGLNVDLIRYSRDIQFNPRNFTDANGYYIIYATANRTAVDNFKTAGNVGIVYRLDFPAMQQAGGIDFVNSSPQFTFTNTAYSCVGTPFSFNFDAFDKDGDELRYFLVAPLQSYLPNGGVFTNVEFMPGYTASNPIMGVPPLSIDQRTGKLTMKATQTGLFVFTVEVEEWRQGQRLGAIRRDFLVPVIDCRVDIPPPAAISYQNKTASEIDLCPGTSAVLSVDSNPNWAYQWKKDGVELSGSTSPRLTVNTTGVYSVTKRFAKKCGGDTTSIGVKVRSIPTPSVTIKAPKSPYCLGDTLTLEAAGIADFRYTWRRNGKLLNGITSSIIRCTENGLYKVEGGPITANCTGVDSLKILFNSQPKTSLTASAMSFCPRDSIMLTTVDSLDYQYSWMPAGGTINSNRLIVKSEGSYQVKVTNKAGCSTTSPPIYIRQLPLPVILFDSIRPVCTSETTPVLLIASPTGGLFGGTSVKGNTFNPQGIAAGKYPVTYTVKSQEGCTNQQTRWVSVLNGPSITLADTFKIKRGKAVQLMATTTDATKFSWTPRLYFTLDDFYDLQPSVQPTKSISYTLTAYNIEGCPSKAKTTVIVQESLYMADAFTPNGDNQNDNWEIRNSSIYPDCEVSIYNRWGQLIYQSTGYNIPWDGTFQQKKVPEGVYTYQIIPDKNDKPIIGTVLVLY